MKAKVFLSLLLPCALLGAAPAAAPPRYPDTAAVLTDAVSGELRAHAAYLAGARKAAEEGFPRIGELFTALAESEAIHAGNFGALLARLGAPTPGPVPAPPVGDTRANLKAAADTELQEIDVRYPSFLRRVQAELQAEAATAITWAWAAERQHRDLVARLEAGSSTMFGLVARKIEGQAVTYYVCRTCGSTLIAIPAATCPNCGNPASGYRKVQGTGS